ncbi:hypothetical protein ACA910_011143 [Epithemia clementina (nom. ined.)]
MMSTGVIHRRFGKETCNYGGSRIPDSLKMIFLESNRGNDVYVPPTDKAAFKVYERPKPAKIPTVIEPKIRKKLFRKPAAGGDNPANEPSECGGGRGESSSSQPQSHPSVEKPRRMLTGSRHERLKERSSKSKSKKSSSKADDDGASVKSGSNNTTDSVVSQSVPSYPSQRSPQVFLDVMLRTLGYSTDKYNTLETSYFNDPTPLQVSSFHARMQELVQSQDERRLNRIMSCGISPNPCNRHGDSVLHTACRSGWDTSVRVLIECGASVQVSDGAGRTPLHSAFFGTKPSYEIVELLIKKDRYMLQLSDRYGATPLAYIPRDQWGIWIDYFYSKRDHFWPRRNKRIDGIEGTPAKFLEKPNSAPLPDPSNALLPEMAAMVAEGKLTPEEARCLADDEGDEETSTYGDSASYCDSSLGESSNFGDSTVGDDDTNTYGDSTHTYGDSTYAESLDDYESIAGDDDDDEFACDTIGEEKQE